MKFFFFNDLSYDDLENASDGDILYTQKMNSYVINLIFLKQDVLVLKIIDEFDITMIAISYTDDSNIKDILTSIHNEINQYIRNKSCKEEENMKKYKVTFEILNNAACLKGVRRGFDIEKEAREYYNKCIQESKTIADYMETLYPKNKIERESGLDYFRFAILDENNIFSIFVSFHKSHYGFVR